MMNSSCQSPNSCDCGDCEYERLVKGKIMGVNEVIRAVRNGFDRENGIPNLTQIEQNELAEYQRLHGREQGKIKFLANKGWKEYYDESIGETYIKRKEKKKFDMSSSPKMYYTPEELPDSTDAHIVILFNNFGIVRPIVVADQLETNMRVAKIQYTKIHFRNWNYEYLYVMDNMREQFGELFLGETYTEKLQKSNKVYI